MCTVVQRFAVASVVIVLGFALILAIQFPEASASENSALSGSHVNSASSIGSIELGPSLDARCKRTAPDDRIQYEECTWAKRVLALMSAEPRDKPWADKMESELSKWVKSLGSEGFILRNVECRLSWCIVEVGSTQGRILDVSDMNAQDARKWKLFEVRGLFAPDIADPNVQEQVNFYKRYCYSVGELLDGNGHLVPNFYAAGKNC